MTGDQRGFVVVGGRRQATCPLVETLDCSGAVFAGVGNDAFDQGAGGDVGTAGFFAEKAAERKELLEVGGLAALAHRRCLFAQRETLIDDELGSQRHRQALGDRRVVQDDEARRHLQEGVALFADDDVGQLVAEGMVRHLHRSDVQFTTPGHREIDVAGAGPAGLLHPVTMHPQVDVIV